jgi:hypothetical protein
MKIKGKSEKTLIKAYERLQDSNPVKAGYIRNYWNKHFASNTTYHVGDSSWYSTGRIRTIK